MADKHTPAPVNEPVLGILLAAIRAIAAPAAILDIDGRIIGTNTAWDGAAISPLLGSRPSTVGDTTFRTEIAGVLDGRQPEARWALTSETLGSLIIRIRPFDALPALAVGIVESDGIDWSRIGVPEPRRALFETDLNGVIVDWSAGSADLFGRDTTQAIGQHISLLTARGWFEFPDPPTLDALRGGHLHAMDLRLKRGTDDFFDGRLEVRMQIDGDGSRLTCEADIVSERQRAGSLRRSDERLRYALEAASDGIWDWDLTTDRIVFTPRVAEIFGGSSDRMRASHIESWNDRIHPEDEPSHRRVLTAHFNGQLPAFESEHRLRTDSGDWKWVLVRGRVSERDSRGNPLRMIGTITDISDRKFAEYALQQSEQRYRSLFEYASDAVILFDPQDSRILKANEKAAHLFGYSAADLLEMRLQALHPPGEWKRLEDFLEHSDSGTLIELDGMDSRDRRIPLEISIRLVDYGPHSVFQSFIRDISERRKLEVELWQSQKMETVGRLAGGIAHDFNNILTAIQGYANLLADTLAIDSDEHQMSQEVLRAVERASRLTSQLLTFSRRDMPNPSRLQLNDIVRDMGAMLGQLAGDHVHIAVELDPDLETTFGDETGIEQVITNLIVNATDAMPDGGTVTIRTANVDVDEYTPGRTPEALPGRYVELSVNDTGDGIDRNVLPRIFEPFFTTKGPGTGTGLGLATVYGVIKRSNGFVTVESEPHHGAHFHIYMPAVPPSGAPPGPAPESPRTRADGKQTVLVVEDEPAVRNLARRFLESDGYTVVEARGATEAIEAVRQYGKDIDLLLTDVVMPGLSGPKLVELLRESQPELKVLYMSGYPGEHIAGGKGFDPGGAYLQKPFNQETLAGKAREVLES
jgi:PAS domain S-box-containing protein